MEIILIAAVAWWLAAPDPVTAGARTAAGTGVRAAGTGVRAHWGAGRDQRRARRTERRDRWWKAGGLRRAALRGEHAAVWTWGAGKTAAGVTAAAVRPVPTALKAGWEQGRERHRTRAGDRPRGLVLDPPWWNREQAPEQPGEQPSEQVQVQPEGSSGNSSGTLSEQPTGTGDLDTEEQIRARRTPTWNRLFPEPLTESDRRFWTERDGGYTGPLDQDGRPGDPSVWPDVWRDPVPTGETVCESAGRYDGSEPVRPIEHLLPPDREKCHWYTPSPSLLGAYCPKPQAPGSNLCEKHHLQRYGASPTDPPAGTSPAGTPTEGDPVSVNVPSEINDLTTLHGFAQAVIDDAEENGPGSTYAQAAASISEYFGRDFGREVNTTASAFEEAAAAFNQAWQGMVEAADAMKNESLAAIGG